MTLRRGGDAQGLASGCAGAQVGVRGEPVPVHAWRAEPRPPPWTSRRARHTASRTSGIEQHPFLREAGACPRDGPHDGPAGGALRCQGERKVRGYLPWHAREHAASGGADKRSPGEQGAPAGFRPGIVSFSGRDDPRRREAAARGWLAAHVEHRGPYEAQERWLARAMRAWASYVRLRTRGARTGKAGQAGRCLVVAQTREQRGARRCERA